MSIAKVYASLWRDLPVTPPDVYQFLREHSSAPAEDCLAALHSDQKHRWRTEHPLRVEEYLARLSELPDGIDWRLQLATGELSLTNIPSILTHGLAAPQDTGNRIHANNSQPLRPRVIHGNPNHEPSKRHHKHRSRFPSDLHFHSLNRPGIGCPAKGKRNDEQCREQSIERLCEGVRTTRERFANCRRLGAIPCPRSRVIQIQITPNGTRS